jgi:cell division septation protein DedD
VESRTLVYALLAAQAWEAEAYSRELEGKLEQIYPGTLDRLAVARESGVSLAPRPSILLPASPWEFVPSPGAGAREDSPVEPPTTEVDPSTGEETGAEEDEPLVLGIQTGSFNDEANAMVMRDEIREEGIPAQVRGVELDGKQYYRVVVPTNGAVPAEEAQELVVRLKELGIEGFLLFAGE